MVLMQFMKDVLNSGNSDCIAHLEQIIQPFQHVSFDLFDTLVKRNVNEPEDIFEIVESKVGNNFKEKRIEAEKIARELLINKEKEEVTLNEIYTYLSASDKEQLIQTELSIEMECIVPNLKMLDIYKKCLKAGKKVYITSDIYWRHTDIEKLLKDKGYEGYTYLYLSSEQNKTKKTGTLFKALLVEENINPHELIHIGDSWKSDIWSAKKQGIHTFHIPRKLVNIKYRGDMNISSITMKYLNHFINNTIPKTEDFYYCFGYSQLGKLLWGYSKWIYKYLKKNNINKLFFFARDGFIMKKAFDICIEDAAIQTYYLKVSRRSLRGPILWIDCSSEKILKMVVNAKLISLQSIFDGIGLNIENYKDIIAKYGFTLNSTFDRKNIYNNTNLSNLLNDIKTDIIENSKSEFRALQKYLKQNNVEGRFGVVDIGYAGSMQCYLQQILTILGIEKDIYGFYLGVADFYTKNELPGITFRINGYLFDKKNQPGTKDIRSSFVGLFESFFLEQDGSVKRYIGEEEVHAERYPYEYVINGAITKDIYKIKCIQEGALDFVRNVKQDVILNSFEYEPYELFEGIYQTGTAPTKKDIEMFADIVFYDEGETEKLAAPKNRLYYIFHPQQLKSDFLKCRWKIGFLKRLMYIPINYQRLYEVIKKIDTGKK